MTSLQSNSTINELIIFSDWFRDIHGWLSTIVCIFGIPCNLLNILVLTRPNMISSPTNLILSALAVSDLLTMMSSLPNSVYFYLLHDPNENESFERDTQFWIGYQMLHVIVSVTFHSISIWLTVYLAFFRYIFLLTATPTGKANVYKNGDKSKKNLLSSFTQRLSVSFQDLMKKCRTYKYTVISIVNIAMFCVCFCVPSYLYPAVREKELFNSKTNKTQKLYSISQSDLELATNGTVYQIMFYSQAIFAKFIPCFLLVTFTSLLISSLIVINKNNKKLNSGYGAKSKLIKDSKSKSFIQKLYFFKKSDKDNQVLAKTATTKIVKGHKNNHFLSTNKNGLNKILNNKHQSSDLNKKYLNEDDTYQTSEFTFNDDNTVCNRKLLSIDSKSPTSLTSTNKTKKLKPQKNSKTKENLRTTLMLVIVCVLFLITEFPQSILMFLSILIDNFYREVYMPLGDLMDLLALTNNSINFVLYCTMSRAFRNTFYSMVSQSCCCFTQIEMFKKLNVSKVRKGTQKEFVTQNSVQINDSNKVINNKGLKLLTQAVPVQCDHNNNNVEKCSSNLSIELKPFIMK